MVKDIPEPTTIRHATEWMAWLLQTSVLRECGCIRTVEDVYCITSGIYYTRLSEFYALPICDQRLPVFNAMLFISILREKPCKKEHGQTVNKITIEETSYDGKEITIKEDVGIKEDIDDKENEKNEKNENKDKDTIEIGEKELADGKKKTMKNVNKIGMMSSTNNENSIIKENLYKLTPLLKIKASDREGTLVKALTDYADQKMEQGIDIYKPENMKKYKLADKFRNLEAIVKPSIWAETTNKYNSLVRLFNNFPGDEYTEMSPKQVEINERILKLKEQLKQWNEIVD